MKQKFFALLVAVLMMTAMILPASAAEYGNIYDETDLLESSSLTDWGMEFYPSFADEYGIDLRVDIITDLGSTLGIEEAAENLYENYDYGYGESRTGISLTVLVHEDSQGLALDDFYLYAVGNSDALFRFADTDLYDAVSPYLTADAWGGDLEEDNEMCLQAVAVLAEETAAFAADRSSGTGVPAYQDGSLADLGRRNVTDAAGLMTEEETAILEDAARKATRAYGCGVYAISVPDYTEYAGDIDMLTAAMDIYDAYDLGVGEDKSGILLIYSAAERDYAVIAKGYGNTAFTDYGREYVCEQFLDDFADDNWYDGYSDFINTSTELLQMAADGEPMDVEEGTSIFVWVMAICGAVVGVLIPIGISKEYVMHTSTEATAYVTKGGLDLRRSHDEYVNTTQIRTKIQKSSGSSSGGTTVNDRGFSGSSGKA